MVVADLFEKLLQAASTSDQAEIKLVHNGRVEAMRAYQKSPGKQAKLDLDAARELYEETVERLTVKYFPEEVPAPEGERFANRKQAFDWLAAQGYAVSRGKFYQDCDAGFPPVHRDKSVSRFQVLQYGQQLDVKGRSWNGAGPADMAARREKAEVDKVEAEARMKVRQDEDEARKFDRRWLLREEAEAETCVWVSRLRDAVAYHLGRNLLAMIHACGGQAERLAEVQAIVDGALAAAANEIAESGELTVTIDGGDEDMEVVEC